MSPAPAAAASRPSPQGKRAAPPMSWERVCACALATKAPFIDPGTAEPVGGTRPEPAASCTRDRARQGCAARCQGNCARSAHFSTDHQKLPERSQRLDCSYPPGLAMITARRPVQTLAGAFSSRSLPAALAAPCLFYCGKRLQRRVGALLPFFFVARAARGALAWR